MSKSNINEFPRNANYEESRQFYKELPLQGNTLDKKKRKKKRKSD